ncbi:MAG: Stp1/IreP family PP2C-type Ser/Thr phosphatase [Deltaproteobacteria bacterium]|nr:Stp1/IreP family PP2C-type Ser/Thr phosphatase [Deltaproteobacteria bacterium]
MRVACSAKTDIGLIRPINEDSFFADEKLGLFMVLDGIGGHNAGEIASKLGVDSLREAINNGVTMAREQLSDADCLELSKEANILKDGIRAANRVIYDAAHSREDYRGMGTTVASLLIGTKSLAIAHVGDSRIYLIRGGTIERLTEDHSLVMEQLKRGLISDQEAQSSDMKNIITRALGADMEVQPALDEIVILNNDIFVLCTDGLTDLVSDEEILTLVSDNRDTLDSACEALINKAIERGGKDNITTIVIQFQGDSHNFLRWCRTKFANIMRSL